MNIIYEEDFAGSYGKAKTILENNVFYLSLLDKCSENSEYGKFIKYANKLLGVPPVKSFLLIFQDEIKKKENGKIEDQNLKQALGSWFGYQFQNKYNMKKSGVKQVGILGVSTATWYK